MIPTFYHSGEIGDLLYGLKAISRVPLANLFLGNDLRVTFDPYTELLAHPNRQLSYRDYLFIRPLLERQPYLHQVVFGSPECIDYNLNNFRKEIFVNQDLNFSDLPVKVCGFTVDKQDAYTPWLYSNIKKEYPITAIRVPRRNHLMFPWKQVVQKYHKDVLFLGTSSEYQSFVEYTGKLVAWKNYTNLLDICDVINGAKVHLGNSTSITVCAEGLKKPVIYENEHIVGEVRYPTHEFHRKNRINVDPDIQNIDSVMEKIEEFLSVK
jgi:hypothetical protein